MSVMHKLHLPSIILHYNGGHGSITANGRYICPYCRGKSSRNPNAQPEMSLGVFGTNAGYSMFKCHRGSCGKSGSAWNLVVDFEGLGGEENKVVVQKMKDLGFLSDDNIRRNEQFTANMSDQSEKIQQVRQQYQAALQNKEHPKIQEMLLRRNIPLTVIASLKDRVGYDPQDESVVFPVEAPSGGVCAIHKIKADAGEQYRHGNNKMNVGPVSRGFFFCNQPEGRFPNVVLVEGVVDALSVASVHPNSYVISSIGLGHNKVLDILEADLQRKLIVCFDNDENQAGITAAKKIAVGLKKVNMVDYGMFTVYDDTGNEKQYKDFNEMLMDNKGELIMDILNNSQTVYGITFQLEDSGALYRNNRENLALNPFNLAKFISKEKQILTHDGDNVYIYNSKCYDMVTEKHFDSIVSKTLMLPAYQQLYKGTIRNEFKNFLSDKTYMHNMKEKEEENRRYLTLDNCLYDLEDHCTLPHTHGIFTTALLPYHYDSKLKAADMPNFGNWLLTTFENKMDMIKYIQEVMGYVLYKGMPRPALFMPIGPPGTSKSLFLDILVELVGEANTCSVRPNKFGEASFLAKMHNKLINVCGEINPRSFEKQVDVIKDISAGGLISARPLYQQPFDFKPYCKQFFACNNYPAFIDNTHALYDRIYVIPFLKQFRGTGDEIVDYLDRIKPEMSAIFNWAIGGLKRLVENDFTFSVPELAEIKKEEWKMKTDKIYNFISTCLEKGTTGAINRRELREVFNYYVEQNFGRGSEISAVDFKDELETKNIKVGTRQGYSCFVGVSYSPDGLQWKEWKYDGGISGV